jgi:hypothetical protein
MTDANVASREPYPARPLSTFKLSRFGVLGQFCVSVLGVRFSPYRSPNIGLEFSKFPHDDFGG